MNDNSEAHDAESRREENFAEGHSRANSQKIRKGSANGVHSNGSSSQPKIDFWVVVDAVTHRWPWIVLGALLFGAGFFELGSWYFKPKFTAHAQLLRDDTSSDFFKKTPMTPETFAGLLRSPEVLHRVGAQADPVIPPEKLAKLIKIEPEPDSELVKVQLSASDPKEAVELLNYFLKQSVTFTKEFQKNQAAKISNDYLKKQVEQMDGDIKVLQDQFRGILPSAVQTNADGQVTAQNATPISPTQLIAIQKQRERLDALFTQLNDLLAKYTERHPSVQATREQIEDLQKQLAALPAGVTNSPTVAARVANSLSRSSAEAVSPETQIFQIRLLSLEEAHTQLKSKQREAELYASNPPGLAHVFAEASMKTVQRGLRGFKIAVLTVFGGFAGIGASFALILLLELFDRKLRTTEDVVRVTKLPMLTTLGDLARMETAERSQWAFRAWTMLQGHLSPSANHGLVCGITSSEAGEGRSTWIELLAEAASMTGFRVLTIATKPSPTHFEPDDSSTGLLSAEYDMSEPAAANGHTTEFNNLDHSNHVANGNGNGSHAIASNVLTSPAQVTEQLTGPNSQPVVHIPLPGWVWNLQRRKQWGEALNHWRKIDNLVIFVELPPASVAEAVLLGSNLPNLVWLADSGKADAGETRAQLQTLRDARCNLVGAVLNREHPLPLRKRFPRWAGCVIMACASILTSASAQDAASWPKEISAAGSPVEVAVAQPANRGSSFSELPPEPPDPTFAFQTNLAFSVVGPSQRAEWQKHLTLGPGDVLNLGLYGAPELTRAEVSVGPDGRLSYLEAQDIRAEGLTVDELRGALDKELANFRRAPRSMVTPIAFRSKRYYILGKVVTKGVYTLDRPMTVLEAVARAHGLENGLVDRNVIDLADFQKSFLARGGKRYPLSFEKLFQNGDLSQNVPIEPGDYIYFPSTEVKEVYVVGEVRLPGAVTYSADTTVMTAITARGGYSERAYKSRVLVVRGSLNNPEPIAVNTHAILDGKEPDFKLEPRDIIYVNSRPFIKVEELADLAVTAFIQSLITSWVGVDLVRPFSQNPVLR